MGFVGKKNPIKDKSGLKVDVLTLEIVTWGLKTLLHWTEWKRNYSGLNLIWRAVMEEADIQPNTARKPSGQLMEKFLNSTNMLFGIKT